MHREICRKIAENQFCRTGWRRSGILQREEVNHFVPPNPAQTFLFDNFKLSPQTGLVIWILYGDTYPIIEYSSFFMLHYIISLKLIAGLLAIVKDM